MRLWEPFFCHGDILIEKFNQVFSEELCHDDDTEAFDALDPECVLAGFDEDDESDTDAFYNTDDVAKAPKFDPNVEAVNETVRSNVPDPSQDRPNGCRRGYG